MAKLPFLASAIDFNQGKAKINQDLVDFRASNGPEQSAGNYLQTSNSFFEKGIVLRQTGNIDMPEYDDNEKMIDEIRTSGGLKTQH